MNKYDNLIANADDTAAIAHEAAEHLENAMEAADNLIFYNGYMEGYMNLKEEIFNIIKDLEKAVLFPNE